MSWTDEYYYLSDYLKKTMINAKIVKIKGGFDNNYRCQIHFDNGAILSFHEDSEGPNCMLDKEPK